MIQQTTIVTTTENKYELDTIEQLCCDSEHGCVIQKWSFNTGKFTEEKIEGEILSVVVVDAL